MPEVTLYNNKGEKVGKTMLSDAVFGAEVKPHLFHEVVRWQLAKRRAGTATVKSRSDVAGSRQKPFRQKGTGRARRGSARKSPLLRGGGVVFGPQQKDWGYTVPKKVRKAALMGALSSRTAENKVFVVDNLAMNEIRTKNVLEIINGFGVNGALLVDGPNEQLSRSSKNLPKSSFLQVDGLNVYDVLRHEVLIISAAAVEEVEKRLGQ